MFQIIDTGSRSPNVRFPLDISKYPDVPFAEIKAWKLRQDLTQPIRVRSNWNPAVKHVKCSRSQQHSNPYTGTTHYLLLCRLYQLSPCQRPQCRNNPARACKSSNTDNNSKAWIPLMLTWDSQFLTNFYICQIFRTKISPSKFIKQLPSETKSSDQ